MERASPIPATAANSAVQTPASTRAVPSIKTAVTCPAIHWSIRTVQLKIKKAMSDAKSPSRIDRRSNLAAGKSPDRVGSLSDTAQTRLAHRSRGKRHNLIVSSKLRVFQTVSWPQPGHRAGCSPISARRSVRFGKMLGQSRYGPVCCRLIVVYLNLASGDKRNLTVLAFQVVRLLGL
jgi:hypothetical protein